jgi:hypothetical protein
MKIHAVKQFLMFQPQLDILSGKTFIEKITYPQTVSARFIHVSRPDAFQR